MKIAIDGYAGSGKSTISKNISKDLGFLYIDTGAMYRMITLYFLERNLDVNQDLKIEELKKINISMTNDDFILNDKNVSREIRSKEVTNNVAKVAAHKNVRDVLVKKQRELSNQKDVILDGRDIGTAVFPEAEVKIFLTASLEERANRRHKQMLEMGIASNVEEQKKDIKKRDELEENRSLSPLKKADDAIEIDSSNLTELEVYKKIKDIILKNR